MNNLKMYCRIAKVLEPVTKRLFRPVSSSSNHGSGSTVPVNAVSKEEHITEALKKSMPGITYISVEDISGGCGAMFQVNIEAKEFVGLTTVKQHRLVTETLKSEIAEMHGIRIHTVASNTDHK